ncbi:hypothetical protein B0T25DRAFT_350428 [Lasiosphaeria hispida]|uniref:Extracellular matrix protein n=1 Tax=Lasiosphaeria hispida TaxID=260671 RepID=A0AAJ0H6S1_9PEZI|nr:hypothetical protein B0T25DRAFT_350428 [Lasiosphaeria hispida]
MKLSAILAGAFAAFALAKPAITNTIFDLREDKPFTVTWIGAVGPVTVTLMTGQPQDLKVVEDLTTSGTGGSFTFTPSDYPSGNYAFRISDSSSVNDPNFSLLFPYVGTGTISTSKSASVSSTASVTASVSSSGSVVSSTPVSSETSVASSGVTTATTSASTTTRASITTTRSTATSSPTNVNSASQRYSSPFALVLIAAAAFALFN